MKSFSEFRSTARLHEQTKKAAPAVAETDDPTEPMDEDAPANNVGGGNIAGAGVGPQGEPGVPARRKGPVLVGPAPSDPRMFRAKIFARKPPQV